MAAKDCPMCGLINPGSAQLCDCGYDFDRGQVSGEARVALAERKSVGRVHIVLGVAMFVAGIGLTTAASSLDGEGFTVFYGLIVAGVLAFGRGLHKRLSVR